MNPNVATLPTQPVSSTALAPARTGMIDTTTIGTATTQIAMCGVRWVSWALLRAGRPMPSWAMVNAIRADALMQASVQAKRLIMMAMSITGASQLSPAMLARSGSGAALLANPDLE